MTKYSLNFRNTVGAWGETPPSGFVSGDLYPSSIAGLTCGWSTAPTKADYIGATNAKLSGRNANNSGAQFFRIDLPNGPGRYRIWIAAGLLSATQNISFVIRDGAGAVLRTNPSTSVVGVSNNPGATFVMDATGAVISYADYISTDGGTFFEFDATQDHIRIERNGFNHAINNIMLEAVELPLSAATLTTEFGTGTHSGSIHPKEPQGHRFGRLTAPTGIQSFSIVGTSTYFTLETEAGQTWLAATGTRIPDGWTGSVTVRQTSGGLTRDTTFNFTAGTLSRPVTGILGKVTSQTLIERARIKAVMDAESWPGYQGQTFVNDLVVTGGADFITKLASLPATGWHRLRLRDGTYTGIHFPAQTNWVGSGGGVLVEPDVGHDPTFSCVLESVRFRGVHFRGLKLIPTANTSDAMFNNDVSAPYTIFLLDQCRVGYGFAPGYNVANWATWSALINLEFCEEVHVRNCEFVGMGNAILISGGRRMRFVGNSFRQVARDFHGLTTAFRFNTPRGVFADNVTYVEMTDCTAWHNPDIYTGLTGALTPHGDWLQIRRTGGAAYPTLTAGVNGSASTPWSVGNIGFNPQNDKIYTVVSVTGSALIDPLNPPTGTGTGIVSGNVTFDYLQDYNLATEMAVLMEGNCILQDGTTINLDGNAQPNVQFVIASNFGWKNTYTYVAVNNICASSNIRGINASSEAEVHAEWNSFVGGAAKALDNDQAQIEGGTIRAHHNILGLISGAPAIVFSAAVAREGNVAANFKNGAASPNRPGDVMVGPFTNLGAIGWGYSMTDDETVTAQEFRSNMSKRLHHLTGAAGAKLREVHTVTVGSDSYTLVIN